MAPRSGVAVKPLVTLTIAELKVVTSNSMPGSPWYLFITSVIAAARTSAGSVTTSDPETSTRKRILIGKTASAGAVGQTSPWISSSLFVTSTGGGVRSSGGLLHDTVTARPDSDRS